MPVLAKASLRIDYRGEGSGPTVVLLHSSVSGNRQWRALSAALSDRYRVLIAQPVRLRRDDGVGRARRRSRCTHPRCSSRACAESGPGPIHLVGHSFGGAVALKAAELLGERLGRLVLLEPNPFHLLAQAGRTRALREALALREHVECFGALGDWPRAAERFADYWLGDGAWVAMPEKRRAGFAAALPPNVHEWDALMSEETPVEAWRDLGANTLLVCDPSRLARSRISSRAPARAGRSTPCAAPATWRRSPRPDLVNPLVREFIDKCLETA